MLDHTETTALKALQARAYGRDGRLTAEELARLHELEAKRRGVAVGPDPSKSVAEPVEVSDGAPAPSTGSGGGLGSGDRLGESVDEPVEVSDTSHRHPRLRWLIAGAAAAVAIGLGVGIGWTLWGQSHDAIALTDEQRGWQEELAADRDYDPGSFVALREEDEVIVWTATRNDGDQTCLLMSNGTESSTACQSTEGIDSGGLQLDLQVPTNDEGTFDVTSANLLFSADGHPAVATTHYRNSFGPGPTYEPEEQKAVDLLIDRGYQESALWIVGYFEDRPVWSGAQAGAGDEQCLVYVVASGAIEEDCGTWEENLDEPLTLTIGPDEAGMRTAEIVYASQLNGPQYLTVTVQPVTPVSVDIETGDVIEFTVDDPTFDDLVIDDKTGESGE